ncbi:DUF302 domain-containing protein, partial [Streptosporangium sp. NPDC048865]|uniref:DUF302 domain-containing protein n=1 Tax=Streptosporangium sp. NPDC048865 TaxID=3155766 RepID=UPI00343C2E36
VLDGEHDPAYFVVRNRAGPHLGIVTRVSTGSVAETLDRLESLIASRGLTLFAVIEHDVAAARAGLSMRPARLVVFGDPASGTPLMVAAPLLALDLPLKILVWQDESGRTLVSHGSVVELQERYGLTDEQVAPLRGVALLASAAAGA